LIIPYYKLTLFKGSGEAYSIHMEHHKVSVSSKSKSVREFFKKIQQQKASISGNYL
jgi:hypothetical protein